MRRFISFITVAAAAIALTACDQEEAKSTPEATPAQPPAAAPAVTPEAAPLVGAPAAPPAANPERRAPGDRLNRANFSPEQMLERRLQMYKDAGLGEEVVAKIKTIVEGTAEKLRALPAEERRSETARELRTAEREAIDKLLTPEMREKLQNLRPQGMRSQGQGGPRGPRGAGQGDAQNPAPAPAPATE